LVFAFGIQFFDCLVELVDRMSVEAGQGSGALLSWKQCFAVRTVFRFGCWSFVLFYGDNFIVTLVVFSFCSICTASWPAYAIVAETIACQEAMCAVLTAVGVGHITMTPKCRVLRQGILANSN